MIVLYCRQNHLVRESNAVYGNKLICLDCRNLLDYALIKIDNCRYGNLKPDCSSCTTHCYKHDMQTFVKKVMRYSGPRMIFYHPLTSLLYIYRKESWCKRKSNFKSY